MPRPSRWKPPSPCAGPLHDECIQLHQGEPARTGNPTATGPATRPTTDPTASRPAGTNPIRAGQAPTARMDNGLLSVAFDEQGNLASLRLKQTGVELLSGPVAPLVIDDPADAWGGGWRQPMKFDNVIAPMKCPAARIVDDGPVLGTVPLRIRLRRRPAMDRLQPGNRPGLPRRPGGDSVARAAPDDQAGRADGRRGGDPHVRHAPGAHRPANRRRGTPRAEVDRPDRLHRRPQSP